MPYHLIHHVVRSYPVKCHVLNVCHVMSSQMLCHVISFNIVCCLKCYVRFSQMLFPSQSYVDSNVMLFQILYPVIVMFSEIIYCVVSNVVSSKMLCCLKCYAVSNGISNHCDVWNVMSCCLKSYVVQMLFWLNVMLFWMLYPFICHVVWNV